MKKFVQYGFRPRSYVGRNSRISLSQRNAYDTLMPILGLNIADSNSVKKIFQNNIPCYLEIGFGNGQSLLELSKLYPHYQFIGVETHKPGVGAVCLALQKQTLNNIHLYHGDVLNFLNHLPDQCLSGCQIFFPDPWPKRKHHPRRLIQLDFVSQLLPKLNSEGTLHLATDWEDYAMQMMKVLTKFVELRNLAGDFQFSQRSLFRPILTKFEKRALKEGRTIWELQFAKH